MALGSVANLCARLAAFYFARKQNSTARASNVSTHIMYRTIRFPIGTTPFPADCFNPPFRWRLLLTTVILYNGLNSLSTPKPPPTAQTDRFDTVDTVQTVLFCFVFGHVFLHKQYPFTPYSKSVIIRVARERTIASGWSFA